MQAAPAPQTAGIDAIHRGRIVGVRQKEGAAECVLSQGAPVLVPAFLAAYLGSGDEIELPLGSHQAGTEIHVRKNAASRRLRELYQTPIGCVTRPKEDKRKELFVAAEVLESRLGIRAVHLPCHALRDYFYVADRHRDWNKQSTFYEVLRSASTAGPAELRDDTLLLHPRQSPTEGAARHDRRPALQDSALRGYRGRFPPVALV